MTHAANFVTGHPRRAFVLVLAVALVLRVGFVVQNPAYRPYGDAGAFDQDAVSLALQGDYPPSSIAPSRGPSGFRPPAYPYLLGAVYGVTGTATSVHRFVAGRLASAVLSTGVVALLGLIAVMLWGWGLAALIATGIAALYPPLVTIGDALLSEPLFSLMTLAAAASALAARREPQRLRWPLAAGLAVGLAALTRTNGIIVLAPIAVGIWRAPRLTAESVRPLAVLVLATAVVIAPWTIRNALAFHRFVPISTESGFTLAGTYNSVSQANSNQPAAWRPPTMAPYGSLLRRGRSEAAIDASFESNALSYIEQHPGYVVRVAFYNTLRLLDGLGPGVEHNAAAESGLGDRTSDLDVLAFYLLCVAAVIAIAVGGLRRVPAFVWMVPVVLAISLIFVIAYMRYRLPIDPFIVLLVAAGVEARRVRAARPVR